MARAKPDHDQSLIHRSENPNWRTPPDLFARLHTEFGFVLDLAATRESSLCGDRYFGPDRGDQWANALAVPWHEYASPQWLNMPYSRKRYRKTGDPAMLVESWIQMCAAEAAQGATVVALCPFAPQTIWWQQYVRHGRQKAREIRTLPHRISFLREDGTPAENAGINHAIVIWTPPVGYVGDWQPAERVWTWKEGY